MLTGSSRRREKQPMIERVEWADRKITGYAERTERTALRRSGHFGHELECVLSRGKGTKEIGPSPFPFFVVKVVRGDV